ncbi:MAG: hypothetical protein ABIH63_03465 [archaeon]
MEINPEIAELCGIILGDGHLHNTENRITITGSVDDLHYYKGYVIPLFQKNFGETPKLVPVKDKNAWKLVLQNKVVFMFFINELGLVRGRKTNIKIPTRISCSRELLIPFMRGLFDTDGYLKFAKQNRDVNYYPRMRLTLYKNELSLSLSKVFKKLNFNFNKCVDRRYNTICYEISGSMMLNRWMEMIGTSNPKHLVKYFLWKRQGYVSII